MTDVREVGFELERFSFTAPGRLEVVGRWSGLEGKRLGRPVLTVEAGDLRRRVTALPGGQFTPSSTGEWRAAFAYDGDPEAVTGAELEVGRRLVAELPRPRRRRPQPAAEQPTAARPAAEVPMAELESLREELAARDVELVALRARVAGEESEREDRRAAERELHAEVNRLRDELEPLRAEHERLDQEQADLYQRVADAERGRDDLVAELGDARTAIDAATAERDGLAEEVERLRATVAEHESELAAERAGTTDVRESLATAREEAQRTIEAEARETERLRAELQAEREQTEQTLVSEREETARLREELAARSAQLNGDDDGGEAESAAKRMYERIARELEHERAAARQLRRELDAMQAETAQHRREASTAAANGITTTDSPAVATPAGRLAAARRTEAGRAAAQHRAGAARAAAAHRVPESHSSPAGIWLVRAGAIVVVAALLVALVLIVSAVA